MSVRFKIWALRHTSLLESFWHILRPTYSLLSFFLSLSLSLSLIFHLSILYGYILSYTYDIYWMRRYIYIYTYIYIYILYVACRYRFPRFSGKMLRQRPKINALPLICLLFGESCEASRHFDGSYPDPGKNIVAPGIAILMIWGVGLNDWCCAPGSDSKEIGTVTFTIHVNVTSDFRARDGKKTSSELA